MLRITDCLVILLRQISCWPFVKRSAEMAAFVAIMEGRKGKEWMGKLHAIGNAYTGLLLLSGDIRAKCGKICHS